MIGRRGRRVKLDMVGGDIAEIRALVKQGTSWGVTLPPAWLELARQEGEITGIAVIRAGEDLLLRPYYKGGE